MRLIRHGPPGLERPGVLLADGARLDVSAFGEDYGETFFGSAGPERLAAWLREHAGRCPTVERSTRLGPPLARPSKIVCIGLNYADHARETGARIPREPVLFLKATSALAGPDDDVPIPLGGSKLDWEVELAVVIGASARHVARERALEHVAGYALHNDYSERSFQLERGGQWAKGKGCDGFAPIGPCLATRDEIPDPGRLAMWLKVNGETRQGGNTADMIFDVPWLVSYVSSFMTLLPGDVISTGTPAGVGLGCDPPCFLREGDLVECGIDRLGSARQRIVKERPPAMQAPQGAP
jgi:2,4-diketo-3-deoxy-L-fuconate hydrolase